MSVSFYGWTMLEAVSALWSAARMTVPSSNVITHEEISRALDTNPTMEIDYLKGRALKFTLKDWPNIDSELYNRDDGENAMQQVAAFRTKRAHDIINTFATVS